ncbi:MAG: STAS/SEC14 domain-containing protein [Pseudomonadota bacterium]
MRKDTTFAMNHFSDIDQLVLVGEEQWKHGVAIFCKPFTKVIVRYFDHADSAGARAWLAEA